MTTSVRLFDLSNTTDRHGRSSLRTAPNWLFGTSGLLLPLLGQPGVHNRILRPLIAADAPPAPLELRRALRVIDHHVNNYIDTARLEPVA